MMKLTIEAVCQKGPKRDNNEDMVSLGGLMLRDDELAFPVELDVESLFYLLVSDGMGGHEQGERASQELLEYLDKCFKENLIHAETLEEDLRSHVKAFNADLNRKAMEEGQTHPMGCTLTGMVWSQGKAYVINAGDSRTYRFRNGILRQLTQDETVRGLSGNPDDSKGLLNCIGAGSQGNLTTEDLTERLHDGDLLLICSDGLTDMLDDEAIEKILSTSERPASDLYAEACRNGGYDNVSIIIAKIS